MQYAPVWIYTYFASHTTIVNVYECTVGCSEFAGCLFTCMVFLKTSPVKNVAVHRYFSDIFSMILPILFESWLVAIAVGVGG